MPKNILVRGVCDSTVEYLENRRRRYWGQQGSWSSMINHILDEWVVRQKQEEQLREQARAARSALAESAQVACESGVAGDD